MNAMTEDAINPEEEKREKQEEGERLIPSTVPTGREGKHISQKVDRRPEDKKTEPWWWRAVTKKKICSRQGEEQKNDPYERKDAFDLMKRSQLFRETRAELARKSLYPCPAISRDGMERVRSARRVEVQPGAPFERGWHERA